MEAETTLRDYPIATTSWGETIYCGLPFDIGRAYFMLEDYAHLIFSDSDMVLGPEGMATMLSTQTAYPTYTRDSEGNFTSLMFLTWCFPGWLANYHGMACPKIRKPEITTEIARHTIEFYFKTFNFHKLVTTGRRDHRLGRMMATRLGFKDEGVFREFAQHNGVWKDYYIKSLLRSEWTGV